MVIFKKEKKKKYMKPIVLLSTGKLFTKMIKTIGLEKNVDENQHNEQAEFRNKTTGVIDGEFLNNLRFADEILLCP